MEEYINFNTSFEHLPKMTQRLFQLLVDFNSLNVSYRSWIEHFCKGPEVDKSKKNKKPPLWTHENIKHKSDIDSHTFLGDLYVAFLSGFTLPCSIGQRIHPRVLIVTGKLADGIRMNLVVLSLCYLYSGLREIIEHGVNTER